ncbi:MAG: hypothetical protein GY878_27635, partial [Fuerstiella sp.]|nr:hypothetical protein [Fuerstiella sp.]
DTASIEAAAAALKAIGGGTLFFPHGTYVVAAMDLVNMNNCLIDLGGSTLTTTDANTTWLVRLRTSNNCKVINGVFEGNRQGRALSSPLGGVNPHNLFVRGGSNIVIENVESNNAVGDGFYVVGEVTDNNTTHPNIDFISCHAATNYRQGLSFIEWTTANVVGGSFNGQTGGDPQSGIDIEPNNASALIDGALVYVSGAEFKSNVHRGILTSGTPASGSITLVVSGCVFSGNANNAIETVHDLVVSDCVFVDCNGSDVAAIQQNSGTGTATKTIVTGCQFTDCEKYGGRRRPEKTTVISDCIVRNSKGLVAADNGNLVVSGRIVESPTTTAITL